MGIFIIELLNEEDHSDSGLEFKIKNHFSYLNMKKERRKAIYDAAEDLKTIVHYLITDIIVDNIVIRKKV
jgi:hypothetical protein